MQAIKILIAAIILAASSVGFSFPAHADIVPLLIDQLGKFHPLFLHYPIVFIVLIPFILVAAAFNWGRIWRPVIPYVVHLGSLSALVTVGLGFASAVSYQPLADQLIYHRNLALAATLFTLFNSGYLIIKKPDFSNKIPAPLLVSALLALTCLTLGAHFGAQVVHGPIFTMFE